MQKSASRVEQDLCNFFLGKSKNVEESNIYEAKAWLLTGKSMIPGSFQIQVESYLLEKRQRNVEGCSRYFETLFHMFPNEVTEEVVQMTNAVKAVTLTTLKETEDEVFLNKVFKSLSPAMQMEVFMHRTEHTPIILEKCQSILLMVKLFPDLVEQHGGNMLYTLAGCEDDVHSAVRGHLVTELVPTVLRLCKNLESSPALTVLLNQCIEYYVLVGDTQGNEDSSSVIDGRNDPGWEKLYDIVDQVGALLQWKIVPFFRDAEGNAASVIGLESLFESLKAAIQRRNHYNSRELAYIAVILFLRCITSYFDKITSFTNWNTGEKNRLTLVEVFLPSLNPPPPDSSLPVLATVTPCGPADMESSLLLNNFTTAAKIWQIIHTVAGERIHNEFFGILSSMTSLNFKNWNVFQEFDFDYNTYVGQHHAKFAGNLNRANNSALKLASMNCSIENYKTAAEYAMTLVKEIGKIQDASFSSSTPASPDYKIPAKIRRNSSTTGAAVALAAAANSTNKPISFSFYNSPAYTIDANGHVVPQRRVHFISENKSEILSYACNILIHCLQNNLDRTALQNEDNCIGHIIALLQMEWYSPTADIILSHLLETIRRKGSFRYYPNFSNFVLECDILEQFMVLANTSNQNKQIVLDIFTSGSGSNASSSRRMGTRGVEKGAKNDMKAFMKKQFLKIGKESLESVIINFLNTCKVDIVNCF